MLILGQAALARPDGDGVLALAAKAAVAMGALKPELGWNGFNVLHTAASRVAGLDLGFVPGQGGRDIEAILDGAGAGEIEIVYLLGTDEIDMARLGQAFVIYQGSHGDKGAHRADVILPGAAYTEKNGTYVNTEGRAQMTARAIFPPGEAREDWKIIRALSGSLGSPLPFESLQALRAEMYARHPYFALIDQIDPADSVAIEQLAKRQAKPSKERFGQAVEDFYLSNAVARASSIMATLSAMHAGVRPKATGTDG
jgi:NADH-quinone oxidoreductase subunit G